MPTAGGGRGGGDVDLLNFSEKGGSRIRFARLKIDFVIEVIKFNFRIVDFASV